VDTQDAAVNTSKTACNFSNAAARACTSIVVLMYVNLAG